MSEKEADLLWQRVWDFVEDVAYHEVCGYEDRKVCLTACIKRAKDLLADREK